MDYRILPPPELPEAEIELPLSKSMSARALVINALSGFDDVSLRVADCDDTRLLKQALVDTDATEIDIDGAGTAMRFLTAYLAASEGRSVTLTGNDRMKNRPIGPLVDALRQLGADISYLGAEGFPPLLINGKALTSAPLSIDASMSSQFVSALLMIAPKIKGGLHLTLTTEIGSMPYVDMTLGIMRQAGAEAERERLEIEVKEGGYSSPIQCVEADWSAAAFWYEIEAISSGFITLLGLTDKSLQGDAATKDIFANLAVNTEFNPDYEDRGPAAELLASPDLSPRLTIDLSDTPDLTPAIAVTCAMVGIPFHLTGLETLRIKECDRIDAISRELRKIGVVTETPAEGVLEWDGGRLPLSQTPEFDTYGDHRMAMALAPVSIYIPGIKIHDVEVVSKSYPSFWADLQKAGFTLVDGNVGYHELFEEGEA